MPASPASRGQTVHDFLERLLVARFVTAFRVGRTGLALFTSHHKPLYAAVGDPNMTKSAYKCLHGRGASMST